MSDTNHTTNRSSPKIPPQEALLAMKKNLRYADGILIWTRKVNHFVLAGDEAGCLCGHGYRRVMVLGRNYYAHQIIWFLCNGEWPTQEIDHIDRNRGNNTISNLRLSTSSQNKMNRSMRVGLTGVKGVYQSKQDGKYVARVRAGCAGRHIGRFATLEEAAAARKTAATRLYGEFANE